MLVFLQYQKKKLAITQTFAEKCKIYVFFSLYLFQPKRTLPQRLKNILQDYKNNSKFRRNIFFKKDEFRIFTADKHFTGNKCTFFILSPSVFFSQSVWVMKDFFRTYFRM